MLKIYLDNCCYNRPFDDRSLIKNYLEREAVLIVMQIAYNGEYKIIGSEVLEKEISMMTNYEKRENVEAIYHTLVSKSVLADSNIIFRAKEICSQSSIKPFDSLHLACAESFADILLTTDVKFMKAANKLKKKVKVQNPIEFLMEVNECESNH